MNDLFPWASEEDEIALNYMQAIDRPDEKTEYLLNVHEDEATTESSRPCGEEQPDDRDDEEARVHHRFLRDGLGKGSNK